MSDYIHLDSILRNREQFPNPAYFEIPGIKTGLTKEPRKVKANGPPLPAPLIYSWSIRPLNLCIPYDADFASLAFLYVDFHSRRENDMNLVASIDTTLSTIRFVFTTPSIQYNNGTPVWIHWFCKARIKNCQWY